LDARRRLTRPASLWMANEPAGHGLTQDGMDSASNGVHADTRLTGGHHAYLPVFCV
jgi:hypothetical protein